MDDDDIFEYREDTDIFDDKGCFLYHCWGPNTSLNILDPQNIAAIAFGSLEEAKRVLKVSAAEVGFKLCVSSKTPGGHYLRLHCEKGSKLAKHPDHLCSCFFLICKKRRLFIISKFITEHNHNLHPEIYRNEFISAAAVQLINKLHQDNLSNENIIKVLKSVHSLDLLPRELQRHYGPREHEIGQETENLKQFMSDIGGIYKQYDRNVDGKLIRASVVTITPEEKANLIEYCDILSIDGTYMQLTSDWTIVPITLIDERRNIRCGGIIYCAFFTIDVVEHFMNAIIDTIGIDLARRKLKVVITDQDNSFECAFTMVQKRLNIKFEHIFCAFHKMQNFKKHSRECGFNKACIEEMMLLFNIISYSRFKTEAEAALGTLISDYASKSDSLKRYITEYITPDIKRFAKYKLGNIFTAGLNTNSIGESMNHLIKRDAPNRMLSLTENRKHIIERLERHRRNILYEIVRQTQATPNVIEQSIGFILPKALRSIVQKEIDFSNLLTVSESTDSKFVVSNIENADRKYEINVTRNGLTCECHFVENSGLPCSHILAVMKTAENQDYRPYFNSYWNPRDYQNAITGNQETETVPPPQVEEELFLAEDKGEQIIQTMQIREGLIGLPTLEMLSNMTPLQRYNLIINESKTAAHLAANSVEACQAALVGLHNLHTDCAEAIQKASGNFAEIHVTAMQAIDAEGHRIGRPRKNMLKYSMNREKNIAIHKGSPSYKCGICGSEISHTEDKCPVLGKVPELLEARERNANEKNKGNKKHVRCKICMKLGHMKKTCSFGPAVSMALEQLEQENMDDDVVEYEEEEE